MPAASWPGGADIPLATGEGLALTATADSAGRGSTPPAPTGSAR